MADSFEFSMQTEKRLDEEDYYLNHRLAAEDLDSRISYEISPTDPFLWIFKLIGKPGSLHAEGIYKFEVMFPKNYPESKFKIRFLKPRPYHRAVFDKPGDSWDDGRPSVSLDYDWEKQAPLANIIAGIDKILHETDEGGANLEAFNLYCSNLSEFEQKVVERAKEAAAVHK